MYLVNGFGVIAMTLGVFLLGVRVFDADRSTAGSTLFGVALLLVGAALFFLPGRRTRD